MQAKVHRVKNKSRRTNKPSKIDSRLRAKSKQELPYPTMGRKTMVKK